MDLQGSKENGLHRNSERWVWQEDDLPYQQEADGVQQSGVRSASWIVEYEPDIKSELIGKGLQQPHQ